MVLARHPAPAPKRDRDQTPRRRPRDEQEKSAVDSCAPFYRLASLGGAEAAKKAEAAEKGEFRPAPSPQPRQRTQTSVDAYSSYVPLKSSIRRPSKCQTRVPTSSIRSSSWVTRKTVPSYFCSA